MALVALAAWPYIPIFFVQVHLRPAFWRRLGAYTYLVVLSEWMLTALVIILFQDFFLRSELELGALSWLGGVLMLLGMVLHVWTGILLGWKGLVGYSELKPQTVPQSLITKGPFAIVRHPTYFAHSLIFVGVFLMTGFVGTGLLASIDFLTSYLVITPLEERELLLRFGDEYRRYKREVPRFLPIPIS